MFSDRTSRRALLSAVSGGLAFSVGGCLDGPPPASRTVEMTDDLTFEPATATVAVGGTVTWVNVGSVGHTVTAIGDGIPERATYFASGGFESESAARENVTKGLLNGDESYEHRFELAGEYEYVCIPHERAGMVGTIQVE